MNVTATIRSITLKRIKQEKLIRLVDPEPGCMPNLCGSWETVAIRTGTVLDVLKETMFAPSPRNSPDDYIHHSPSCAWYQWAMREIARDEYRKDA